MLLLDLSLAPFSVPRPCLPASDSASVCLSVRPLFIYLSICSSPISSLSLAIYLLSLSLSLFFSFFPTLYLPFRFLNKILCLYFFASRTFSNFIYFTSVSSVVVFLDISFLLCSVSFFPWRSIHFLHVFCFFSPLSHVRSVSCNDTIYLSPCFNLFLSLPLTLAIYLCKCLSMYACVCIWMYVSMHQLIQYIPIFFIYFSKEFFIFFMTKSLVSTKIYIYFFVGWPQSCYSFPLYFMDNFIAAFLNP